MRIKRAPYCVHCNVVHGVLKFTQHWQSCVITESWGSTDSVINLQHAPNRQEQKVNRNLSYEEILFYDPSLIDCSSLSCIPVNRLSKS